MNKDFIGFFESSIRTGFIDDKIDSEILYQPELLVNNKEEDKKVLSTILDEFKNCDSFYISVAFVTSGGVASIINTLQELKERNIKGKLLVSQYLNFTEPVALKRLLQFDNIELKVAIKGSAHSKGYIFKYKEHYNLIIGSSNLTQAALSSNKEWNLKVSATQESKIAINIVGEFEKDFNSGTIVDEEYLFEYQKIYDKAKLFRNKKEKDYNIEIEEKITPNLMQKEALKNLVFLRKEKKQKALVISATGTGKTYLAAFNVK